ncbi:MAG: DNA polymerase III subunit beta [Bacilli bacterium]
MRFTIKRDEFVKGLTIVGKAVASKITIAVLANIKIQLNETGLFLTGSNFDLTIRTMIPYKDDNGNDIIRNYKEGSTLINAKIISEIARKMEEDEITLEIIDSTIVTISDSRSEYKLNCVRVDEYPDIDLDASGTEFTLPTSLFALLVDQTAFAASTKEHKPLLTAINLEAADGILTATTTDSARLARKQISVDSSLNFTANIPARMMMEVERLIEGSSAVAIAISDKKALFTFKNTVVSSRLVVGDYPNTKNIVPKFSNYTLEVNAIDLIKAIDRANILSIDRENVVNLKMSSEGVSVTSKSSQVGSAVERIETYSFDGQMLDISFNSEFVVSAIKALGSEDVVFSFIGEMKPFVIKNPNDNTVIQIVTPMRTF